MKILIIIIILFISCTRQKKILTGNIIVKESTDCTPRLKTLNDLPKGIIVIKYKDHNKWFQVMVSTRDKILSIDNDRIEIEEPENANGLDVVTEIIK